ncbi:MAG: sialate O-acetylesterase [Mesorhizobium sp.]|nr:MAG: sialate O-acetylesterase [Mesorhizobium sp.]
MSAQATIGGIIYDTTAAGIAATTNGQFFIVKGDGVNTYALSYKNVAGVATLIASYPSKTALDATTAEVEAVKADTKTSRRARSSTIDPEIAAGTVDAKGRLLLGVLAPSGLVHAPRMSPPSGLAYVSTTAVRAVLRDGTDILLSAPGGTHSRLVQNGDTVSFWREGDDSIDLIIDELLSDVSSAIAAGVTTLYFVPVFGQSNGAQFGGYPALSVVPDTSGRVLTFPHGTNLISGAIPLPLHYISHLVGAYEGVTPASYTGGETPSTGLGWSMAQILPSTAAIITASLAIGGAAITTINKGTLYYRNLIRAVQRVKVMAGIAGLNLIVPAVAWFQGEANGATAYATYDAAYDTLQNDLDVDIKAITGQAEEVLLAAHQISAWTYLNVTNPGMSMLVQIDRAISTPTRFLCSGVNYIHFHTDGVHTNNVGKRSAGETLGRAIARRLVSATTYPMLHMTGATRAGAVITVAYAGNEGALAFDTSVNDPGSKGFRFSQTGGNSVTITDVSIVGTTVEITLSGIPTGTAQTVRYALNDTASGGGGGGVTTGPRGQLRDSATFEGADETPRYNWAQHQSIIIT